MQAIKDLAKNVKLPLRKKNIEYCVNVTHITNPHLFYVRPAQFSMLIECIEQRNPSKYVPLVDTIFPRKRIIFNMNCELLEPKYARGQIAEVEDYGCKVYALDYGCYRENVLYDLMWECDECLIDIPPLAINCQLANCVPRHNNWSEATHAFRKYVSDERLHMLVIDRTITQLIVTLENSFAADIATLLALSNKTTLGFLPFNLERNTTNDTLPPKVSYEFKQLELNDDLHVRVLSGKSLDGFYVAEVNDFQEYVKEQDNLDFCAIKAKAVDKDSMKCGDSVLVWRGSTSFDRGFIKEIYRDSECVNVQMVDTGKYKTVNVANLKITPPQCVQMPAIAIYCSVKGKVTYDLNLLLHPGKEFIITCYKLGKQLYFETPSRVTLSHCQKQCT